MCIQTNITGLNWYIPIFETSLFHYVPRTGMDTGGQGIVQTDTVTDNRLVTTLMMHLKYVLNFLVK